MDRLKFDINEANKTLSKFQDGLEQVRIHIEEIEQKPRPFIPNSRTFNGNKNFESFVITGGSCYKAIIILRGIILKI